MDAQSRSRNQKLFTSFINCFSMSKQNSVLEQNLLFLRAGIFSGAYFSSKILHFRQESSFLALLMVRKGQGLFFISEKVQGAFLSSKNEQGALLIF